MTDDEIYGLSRAILKEVRQTKDPLSYSKLEQKLACSRGELLDAFKSLKKRGYAIRTEFLSGTNFVCSIKLD